MVYTTNYVMVSLFWLQVHVGLGTRLYHDRLHITIHPLQLDTFWPLLLQLIKPFNIRCLKILQF